MTTFGKEIKNGKNSAPKDAVVKIGHWSHETLLPLLPGVAKEFSFFLTQNSDLSIHMNKRDISTTRDISIYIFDQQHKSLHPLTIPKARSVVVTARDKSRACGGVGEASNVIVVTWKGNRARKFLKHDWQRIKTLVLRSFSTKPKPSSHICHEYQVETNEVINPLGPWMFNNVFNDCQYLRMSRKVYHTSQNTRTVVTCNHSFFPRWAPV